MLLSLYKVLCSNCDPVIFRLALFNVPLALQGFRLTTPRFSFQYSRGFTGILPSISATDVTPYKRVLTVAHINQLSYADLS